MLRRIGELLQASDLLELPDTEIIEFHDHDTILIGLENLERQFIHVLTEFQGVYSIAEERTRELFQIEGIIDRYDQENPMIMTEMESIAEEMQHLDYKIEECREAKKYVNLWKLAQNSVMLDETNVEGVFKLVMSDVMSNDFLKYFTFADFMCIHLVSK